MEIRRRSIYDRNNGYKTLRVLVSAPFSCRECHDGSGNITKEEDFARPIRESKGFREYVKHLGTTARPARFIEAVETSLSRPAQAMQVPGFAEQLAREGDNRQFVGDDYGWYREATGIEDAPWGARVMTVIDPFSNRIRFSERTRS
jgi:hypothetical protein